MSAMTHREKFVRECGTLMFKLKYTLGDSFDEAMCYKSIEIIQYQHRYNISNVGEAVEQICAALEEDGFPTDRFKAACCWLGLHQVFMAEAFDDLLSEI